MACKYTIHIVEFNAFTLVMPLKRRTFVSNVPIDEDIDIMALVGCKVKVGGVEYHCVLDPSGVQVAFAEGLKRGVYDVIVTATYRGAEIRAAYFEAIQAVEWNRDSDAQQFIAGSPITLDTAYVIGGPMTDAELEALKAEWRLKIAAAEKAQAEAQAAKEEYDRKAEMLDDVAQQSTLTQGVTDIRGDIAATRRDIANIDLSPLAKQGENADATNTAIYNLIQNEGIERANEYATEIREIIGDWKNE